MRILVTGAAGFLGRALLRTLASRSPEDQITALDIAPPLNAAATGRISWLSGALDDRDTMERAGLKDFDIVYHLASVPGALAEREPALGRRVNLDATLDLFDRLAACGRRPRVVYASSVAVYGDMDGRPIGVDSPARPTSTYGAHKRMAEIALLDHSRRGELSGIALRLPGLIARPGKSAGFGSAFMSELPRAYAAGKAYDCPVSPEVGRMVDVRRLRGEKSAQGRLDRCLRRGSASGSSLVGSRDRRCAFRSLRTGSPFAHILQAGRAH